jgi:hypothetical protein
MFIRYRKAVGNSDKLVLFVLKVDCPILPASKEV